MESPAERVQALMNEFRRDASGWKLELAQLKAEGQIELVATIEGRTNEAERVLTRWEG
jgi:hypothetical protein